MNTGDERDKSGQVTKPRSETARKRRPLDTCERRIGVRASESLADTGTMLTLPVRRRDAGMRKLISSRKCRRGWRRSAQQQMEE